ncbi:MAG: hypothetical protein H6978_14880 [Gammaproteobacteria bacterium]|nr:hypothetical protein [Gammaproteobacteria bacterium]
MSMTEVDAFLQSLMTTAPAHLVTQVAWAWPICETLHFIGLVLMTGVVGVIDLHVLGGLRGIGFNALHRLLPWGIVGFVLCLTTGAMFFAAAPEQYFYNQAFHIKATALLFMGLNVTAFYLWAAPRLARGDGAAPAPAFARFMALLSLLLMVVVIGAGRMLTFFRPPFNW